uniref:Formin-binding protein 1-like n=1 Tax=Panagrolaimus sp. JU765 TaxID=591449 RepID=A0AC34QR14_9BILA
MANQDWSKLWDQTDSVANHQLKGIEFFEKYGNFVKERALIEEEYATKLRNLAKKNMAKKKDEDLKAFSYMNTFHSMLRELESLAGQHEVIADQLKKEIHPGVMAKAAQFRQVRKAHLTDLTTLNTQLDKVVDYMDKAQKNYGKAFKDAEAAHIKYIKNDENMNLSRADVEKSKNVALNKRQICEEAKQTYAHALETANKAKADHYGIRLPSVLAAMRTADMDRINETKHAMRRTIEAEASVMKIIQVCYDEMMRAVVSINPEADTLLVVEQNASGYAIPEDYSFDDLGDPAETMNGDNADSASMKRGTLPLSQKNGTTGKGVGRRQSMHQKFFGGSGEKTPKSNGNGGEYGNLPPQQRCRKIQSKIEELQNEEEKLQNSLNAAVRMIDVYKQNPKLGNPKDVEPKVGEYKTQIGKVQGDVAKYKAMLDQIQAEMKSASIHSADSNSNSLKLYNQSSNHSSPRISSSGVSSNAHTNRTSYSEESVSSEGSNGFANKKMPTTPLSNGIASPIAVAALKEVSPPRVPHKETHGANEEYELPVLGTCRALYSFEGSSDGTTVPMKEGDEMLLLEKDEGDGWTRIRHLTAKVEGFVPTSYLNCQWYPFSLLYSGRPKRKRVYSCFALANGLAMLKFAGRNSSQEQFLTQTILFLFGKLTNNYYCCFLIWENGGGWVSSFRQSSSKTVDETLESQKRNLSTTAAKRNLKTMALYKEITARQNDFMKAFNSGNVTAAAEIYHPEGYFMPNGHAPIRGRKGIEEYFKADVKDGVATAQIITEEVDGSDNFAYERGSYHLNGTKGVESGTYLQIWKKDGGVWHIYTDCFNVTKPASL